VFLGLVGTGGSRWEPQEAKLGALAYPDWASTRMQGASGRGRVARGNLFDDVSGFPDRAGPHALQASGPPLSIGRLVLFVTVFRGCVIPRPSL